MEGNVKYEESDIAEFLPCTWYGIEKPFLLGLLNPNLLFETRPMSHVLCTTVLNLSESGMVQPGTHWQVSGQIHDPARLKIIRNFKGRSEACSKYRIEVQTSSYTDLWIHDFCLI